MSDFFNTPAVWTGVQLLVKASLLVSAGVAAQWLIGRRMSAAARHLAFSFIVVGLLGLPLLTAVLPSWQIALPVAMKPSAAPIESAEVSSSTSKAVAVAPMAESATGPVAATPTTTTQKPARTAMSWSTVLVVLYAWGVLVLLTYLAAEQLWARRLALQATVIEDQHWRALLDECRHSLRIDRPVRLLRSRQHTMPMVLGMRSPAILLPAVADTWTDDRRRAVVLHELAHIIRRDCLAQTLAAIACAAYWPHPGVWWIARRLKIERELACDDLVLTAGTSARDYAGHLLELAHTLGGGRAPALVVTMARPRQLEGRMLAVMDARRSRVVPGLRSRLAGLMFFAAIIVPLASANPVVVDANAAPSVVPAAGNFLDAPGLPNTATESVVEPLAAPKAAKPGRAPLAVAQSQASQSSNFRGTWEIRQSQRTGMIQLRLREANWDSSFNIPLDRIDGLSSAQLLGAGGPVRFSIRRDAGTFNFDGTSRDGFAGGVYSFSPNPQYGSELEKRGYGRPTEAEQYSLARGDIGFTFLDELTKQSYPKPSISLLVRAGDHGVHYEYLRDMGSAGYRVGALETLIRLRDHGVTPEFIRELADQNVKGLSADELQRIRDHGVNGEFVRAFRDMGYGSATVDQLVNARDHGVTPDYVKEIAALGKTKLTIEELIRIRDHGVTSTSARELRDLGYSLSVEELVKAKDHGVSPDFVRELASQGHKNVPLESLIRLKDHGVSSSSVREYRELGYTLNLEELVKAKDHGVSTDFVRELAALGYSKQPMEALVRLRDHGVSASYLNELKELGYDRLDLEDVVSLRDHGVTPDKIRRANERAGTRLPLDMIRALASGGMK
jgi:beta-lactamase regulating signal transducer with metallopeptidase domain